MKQKRIQRLILIEPGLRKTGHPAEVACALQLAAAQQRMSTHLICTTGVDPAILSRFNSAHLILSQECFPVSEAGAAEFAKALEMVRHSPGMRANDLVIISSAHVNELVGLGAFLRDKRAREVPWIALNFHQIYPPAEIATEMIKPEYQQEWEARLRTAFEAVPKRHVRVSYWSSPCDALTSQLTVLAGQSVLQLPFPLGDFKSPTELIDETTAAGPTITFLGDGRHEKGLLVLLRAMTHIHTECEFVIQNLNPRGYPSEEHAELKRLLSIFSYTQQAKILTGALTSQHFRSVVSTTTAVALPYDPQQYERRASMVFALAVAAAKPVIVPDETPWAYEIDEHRASGVSFRYDSSDYAGTAHSMADAIKRLCASMKSYVSEAQEYSYQYRERHNARVYLETLLSSCAKRC